MFYHISDAATLGIVQRCRGMQNAWMHGPIGAKGVFAGLAALPRLERLHCDASFLGHLADAPPHAFARLSHLELFDSAPALKHVESLATALPALTHLALNDLGAQDLEVCLQILDRCSELRVLAILETPVMLGLDMDSDENLQDAERDVFESTLRLVRIFLERYTEDWTSGVLTGRDFWQRAEELVARRGIYVSEARTFRVASH
ncbi:unnamed protein product [Mycena citricolor]|uniref:Uncharacterized protein n=1 Tax=Mycena citricolor TaxID=2018698 RepID=A0AAD2HEP6_9AGAR|nr:unnamed protein product [Mycena citricolor]